MKNIEIKNYQNLNPSLESYWRSIILFGMNTSTYKFSLAQSLINLTINGNTEVTFDKLSELFSFYICEHLKKSPIQTTGRNGKFLQGCIDYNNNKINRDELISITKKHGFNYVLDAFHKVAGEDIDVLFYEKSKDKLILTDNLFDIKENENLKVLSKELEARWNLVEKSWELGINANLLEVKYDRNDNGLYTLNKNLKRVDITSVRNSLNGYQKGKCFYCNGDYSIDSKDENLCEVDHFYPHRLKKYLMNYTNLDGVWNLVLACKECNRGQKGKFSQIPDISYIEKLIKRNEYLITSHNPLRETIINQTGKTRKDRINFIKKIDKESYNLLPIKNRWRTLIKGVDLI